MRSFIIFSFLLMLSSANLVLSQEIVPEEVLSAIKIKGARAVVDEIWASEEKTKQLLSGIRSAEPMWLDVAKAIALGTDAGSSEELNDAISIALLKAPYSLLPWLRDTWWQGTNDLCLFGYDSELPGGVATYVEKLQRALTKRPPKELEQLRRGCQKGLQKTKGNLRGVPK